MKSVLRSIALRIEEPKDGVQDDSRPSTSSESTSEQLAELKLLSRVEHDGASPSTSFTSGEGGDEEHYTRERRGTGRVEKKSMFTALLGSANKVTVVQPNDLLSPSMPKITTTPERFRRGSTMPTLSEEASEEAFEEEGDVNLSDEDEIAILERSGSCDSPDIPGGRRPSSRRCENGFDGQITEAEPEDADSEEEGDENKAFADMVSQLPRDFECLALLTSDLTTRRLDKVRAALTSQIREPADSARGTDQRVEASECATSPAVSRMRQTRTLVAVDTVRMLVQRYGAEKVGQAVTSAVRQVFKEHTLGNGIDALAQAPIVVTSNNIARVALDARHALLSNERPSQPNNTQQRHYSISSSASRQKTRQHAQLRSPSPLRTTVSGRSQTSPNQLRSPRGDSRSPTLSDTRSIAASSPLTPQPRSILASDGAHVLMQEKISAFQYRGVSDSGLSSFKVRRDGVAKAEAAAIRRQRSIAYGNEQTRKPAMK